MMMMILNLDAELRNSDSFSIAQPMLKMQVPSHLIPLLARGCIFRYRAYPTLSWTCWSAHCNQKEIQYTTKNDMKTAKYVFFLLIFAYCGNSAAKAADFTLCSSIELKKRKHMNVKTMTHCPKLFLIHFEKHHIWIWFSQLTDLLYTKKTAQKHIKYTENLHTKKGETSS